MKHSEAFIEDRIRWRAKENGLPKKHSFFFEDLPKKEKDTFHVILQIAEIGTPILFFYGKQNTWTIFGTKKVISGKDMNFDGVAYLEIDDFTVGDWPFHDDPDPDPETLKKLKKFKKAKQYQVFIKDKSNRIITLNGPKGMDLYAITNIILMLQRLMSNSS